MIERIEEHVVDLLYQNPVLLCAGGTSYAPGWAGVTREMTAQVIDKTGVVVTGGVVPSPGYVNLFDRVYTKDNENARPGIYMGGTGYEASDEEDFPVISGGQFVEYRILRIQLMITVTDQDQYVARKKRAQLRYNVRGILRKYLLMSTYWWQLRMPGRRGGGDMSERHWMSATGGGSQGIVEAYVTMPVAAHYQDNSNTTYA